MRIGMVCPYSFDHPGGVQIHIQDLCAELRRRGHEVEILAPGTRGTEPDEHTTFVGPGIGIAYNGSVARLAFGPRTWKRTGDWIARTRPDVLHIHEPNAPGTGMFALAQTTGPIVATFHTATTSSAALKLASGALAPLLEKIRGRIAVSDVARRWQIQALGSDAVEIPNGVDVSFYRSFREAGAQRRAARERDGGPVPTVCFLGRFDEPRKGFDTLLQAWPQVRKAVPDAQLLVMGGGDRKLAAARLQGTGGVEFLGRVSAEDKAATLASCDVYCAPNTGGESFGIVLVEAMAAGTAVLAADIDAFRRVLRDGACGVLFRTGNADSLAAELISLLREETRRAGIVAAADAVVDEYDWPTVCDRVLRVYDTVRGPGERIRLTRISGLRRRALLAAPPRDDDRRRSGS